MNINVGDALLTSLWATDTVTANGINYGSDIPLDSAGRFLEGRVKVRFQVTTAFTGAGDVSLVLYSGAAASPTAVNKTIYSGTKVALTVGTYEIVLETHALSEFNRLGVNNSGAASTGAIKADFVPIAS